MLKPWFNEFIVFAMNQERSDYGDGYLGTVILMDQLPNNALLIAFTICPLLISRFAGSIPARLTSKMRGLALKWPAHFYFGN